ncbi:monocarboxylate transporter [Suhomyces tanzawaensis NRRL Y-17324]|uniref:Monocarboxylate transporter n=1 Tax=Suhomyces tanzawaensis NRRL Y-17324 TaxID=984487 RepID=A0A1E4SI57_9ASCO|nr:monocarboxylate transporter [Suhomyces tanzawaensis NRRL Y-17324]ODV79150.1 monocarboxylate transporter [Suhomyces tanzawaensis NRRL Y-17324]
MDADDSIAKKRSADVSSQPSLDLMAVPILPSSTYDPAAENAPIAKVRSGTSGEVSRIISGIWDDLDQDAHQRQQDQRDQPLPDEILLNQLEMVSRKSTAKDKDVEAMVSLDELPSEDSGPPVDTGFAWVIALCGMLAAFSTWGSNASYGVFLGYYLEHDTFHATPYDFALIGGIVVCLAQTLAPISAFLYSIFGFKTVVGAGIVIQTAGYILASFATKLWHLYLTQGVLVGISFVLIFIPASLVVPTWFLKSKATAIGITVSGAGLGGVVIALSVHKVVDDTGNQKWALRMVGFMCLFTSMVVWLVMKPRNSKPVPLSVSLKKDFLVESAKLIFDIKIFRNYALFTLTMWFGIILIGYVLLLFSMASYATSVGLSSKQGSILTSVLNGAQVIGRPSMGLAADRLGRANLVVFVCFMITLLTFAYWINATTFGALVGFSILIGLIVGIGSSMAQPLAIDILEDEPQKAPAAWSGMNIFCGLCCLVSEVIALALRQELAPRPFLHTQIFCGCIFAFCLMLGLMIREWMVRRTFKKRLNLAYAAIHQVKKVNLGYLKAPETQGEQEDIEILNSRVERYERLLQNNFLAVFVRTFYPIKV